MRGAKSLVCAVLLGRGMATVSAASAASGVAVLLATSIASAEPAANHVRDVRVRADDAASGAVQIEIVGTGAPTYSVRVADGGRRLLVDLSDSDVVGAPGGHHERRRGRRRRPDAVVPDRRRAMTRLTVTLQREASYRIVPDGTTLRLLLTPGGIRVGGRARLGASARRAGADVDRERPRHSLRARVRQRGGMLRRNGCDRVVVDLGEHPGVLARAVADGRLRLELRATALPDALARTLDVAAYRGVLKSITASQDAETHAAVIELDRSGDAPGIVSVEGGALVWSFPVPKSNAPAPPIARVHIDGKAVGKDGGARAPGRHRGARARGAATCRASRRRSTTTDPKIETHVGGEAAGLRVERRRRPRAAALQRAPHRPRPQGRRHPQRPAPARRRRPREHRHRRRRDRRRSRSACATCPGIRRSTSCCRPRASAWSAQGNMIRVAPLGAAREGARARARAAEAGARARAARDAPHPGQLRAGRGAPGAREGPALAARLDRRRRAHQRAHRARRRRQPEPDRGARPLARHADAAGARRGAHRRGDEPLPRATSASSGAATPPSARRPATRPASRSRRASASPAAPATATRRPPVSRRSRDNVANPNFAVNLPGRRRHRARWRARPHVRLDRQHLQPRACASPRPSRAACSASSSSPRILTLDNREARISQGTLIPFSQVSAQGVQTTFQEAKLQLLVKPHVTADGSVSMHVKINRDEPDFNQTSRARRSDDPEARGRDRSARDGRPHRGHRRHLHAQHRPQPRSGAVLRRHPDPRRALPAPPRRDTRSELVIFLTPRIVNRAEALGR